MKKNSLNIEIWKYLILFSIFILAFLWAFQVLFLNKYYRWEKIKDIKEVAKKIEKSKSIDNLKYVINNAAYNKNICVEITDNSRSLYSSKFMSTGCLTGEEEKTNYKSKFINSISSKETFTIKVNITVIRIFIIFKSYFIAPNYSNIFIKSTISKYNIRPK